MSSGRDELALLLARHQRVDAPSGRCTCGLVVPLGRMFSGHLADVAIEAGWTPRDTIYRAARQRQADAEQVARHFQALATRLRGQCDDARSEVAAQQVTADRLRIKLFNIEHLWREWKYGEYSATEVEPGIAYCADQLGTLLAVNEEPSP